MPINKVATFSRQVRLFHLSTSKLRLLALSIVFCLSGCQSKPLDIHSYMDEGIDFSRFKSIKVETLNRPSHRVIGYMNSAIEANLSTKGYDATSTKLNDPDLIVAYQVTLNRGQKLVIEEIPAKGQLFTRPLLEAVNKAQILVNAYDPVTHEVIWKASTTRDIRNVDATKIDQDRVNDRVNELFTTFPARN